MRWHFTVFLLVKLMSYVVVVGNIGYVQNREI